MLLQTAENAKTKSPKLKIFRRCMDGIGKRVVQCEQLLHRANHDMVMVGNSDTVHV